MFQKLTFCQAGKSSTRNSSIFFGSSMLNSLRRLLYFSSRFLVIFADDKIIGKSISAVEYARATSSILSYPLTEIPLTVKES